MKLFFTENKKKRDMVSYRYVNFAKNWLKEKKDVSSLKLWRMKKEAEEENKRWKRKKNVG